MSHLQITNELERNSSLFQQLLQNKTKEEYTWKASKEQWSLLDIICHLYDEERDDFRARVKHVLLTPNEQMPSIDPVGWVEKHEYHLQDYDKKIVDFLQERATSISWLRSLEKPNWASSHLHPVFGTVTAKMFLDNWLAHDYLHLRQIIKTNYSYLQFSSKEDFRYAGDW